MKRAMASRPDSSGRIRFSSTQWRGLLLTRQVCRSHSGLQAGSESRRRSQRMVIPLASARTQSRTLLEAPNILISNDRPQCGFRQTALSKLALGVLQRRFAALLPKATLRLNAIYIPAGLIANAPAGVRHTVWTIAESRDGRLAKAPIT